MKYKNLVYDLNQQRRQNWLPRRQKSNHGNSIEELGAPLTTDQFYRSCGIGSVHSKNWNTYAYVWVCVKDIHFLSDSKAK